MIKREYFVMDYDELEELVSKEFGLSDWSFVVTQEAHNYTSYSFNDLLIGTVPLYNPEDNWFPAQYALEHLVNRGVLMPGNYLIEVFW